MEQIEQQISALKAQLTGDLFSDIETQQKIYELKKQLNPEIESHPEQDDDEIKEIIETDAQDEYDLKEASKQLYSYLDDVFENPTTNI